MHATALIDGDEVNGPNPSLSFLWLDFLSNLIESFLKSSKVVLGELLGHI